MTGKKDLLERAYAIRGQDDARALYADWAETYDQSFGAGYGYVAPRRIAEIYRTEAVDAAPVLDVGAGTGLLAEHLRGLDVDAIDLSAEMLKVAEGKGLYRRRIVADVTAPLAIPDDTYGGVVSSGTFTHGHVGPECLPELLRVARVGAVFACGVVAPVLDGAGFGSTLARLVAHGRITPVRFHEIAIYEGADHAHADARGLVMVFRKL